MVLHPLLELLVGFLIVSLFSLIFHFKGESASEVEVSGPLSGAFRELSLETSSFWFLKEAGAGVSLELSLSREAYGFLFFSLFFFVFVGEPWTGVFCTLFLSGEASGFRFSFWTTTGVSWETSPSSWSFFFSFFTAEVSVWREELRLPRWFWQRFYFFYEPPQSILLLSEGP